MDWKEKGRETVNTNPYNLDDAWNVFLTVLMGVVKKISIILKDVSSVIFGLS